MRKKITVTQGEKYGKLTVIREINPRINKSGGKERRVLCSCDCGGKEVEVGLSNLITGKTTSCGCSRKKDVKPGDKYGRLTIVREIEQHITAGGNKKRMFLCTCSCDGKEVEVSLDNLRSGNTVSCGCYNKEKNKKYNDFHIDYDTGIVTGITEDNKEFYFDIDNINTIKGYYWNINDKGYVFALDSKTDKKVLMHRLIMNLPNGKVVDHIDHNRKNNCKSNLRVCTHKDNCRNLLVSKNNTSGITGVNWNKENNKWRARITFNGKLIHLGYFDTKEEATKARYEAELELFGEYSPNYQKLTQQQSIQNESNQQSQQNT